MNDQLIKKSDKIIIGNKIEPFTRHSLLCDKKVKSNKTRIKVNKKKKFNQTSPS